MAPTDEDLHDQEWASAPDIQEIILNQAHLLKPELFEQVQVAAEWWWCDSSVTIYPDGIQQVKGFYFRQVGFPLMTNDRNILDVLFCDHIDYFVLGLKFLCYFLTWSNPESVNLIAIFYL